MSFDRLISVLALIVALTGGIPTLISIWPKKPYFEISSTAAPSYTIQNESITVQIPVNIFNASDSPAVIFAVGYEISDEKNGIVSVDNISFQRKDALQSAEFPIRLEPGDNFSLTVPIFFDVTNVDGPLLDHLDTEEDISARDIFARYHFPDSERLTEVIRGACDRMIMGNGKLARCVRLAVALAEQRTSQVGEFAIAFIPSKKGNQ